MADPVTRNAARWAAVIALPVALVAGLLAYRILSASSPAPAASPTPAPQSTAPVPTTASPLPTPAAAACQLLVANLPDSVRDRPRRLVTAGAEQNAAFGDPPITLACGTGAVASVVPTATVYNLSGVCWYPDRGQSATAWTTVDRPVPVTVTVPNSYDAQAQWVIGFSAPVAGSLTAVDAVPSGCKG